MYNHIFTIVFRTSFQFEFNLASTRLDILEMALVNSNTEVGRCEKYRPHHYTTTTSLNRSGRMD